MGSKFYLQSASTSATSLPSVSNSNHRLAASPSPSSTRRKRAPLSIATALVDDSDEYSDGSDIDTTLPFPAPLPRSDFLTEGPFDPSAYLSSVVANRYQTLEDLREELRTRVQTLNTELVELVNAHQEEFVGLGSSLRGGEERVEEVKVGVLGLTRELNEVRAAVDERMRIVEKALGERRAYRADLETGRSLLEFDESLRILERKLGLEQKLKTESDVDEQDEESQDSEDEEDDEDGGGLIAGVSLSKLKARIEALEKIERLKRRVGLEHPFIRAQQSRLVKCRDLLLLDLGNCLKHMKTSTDAVDADSKMQILALHASLRSSREVADNPGRPH